MELLAPAGSISALKCAVHNGADAVYLGLGEHNARSKCTDFNLDNLASWVDYCHLYGVKAYVTVNTSVKEAEKDRICSLIAGIQKSNADAIIACDLHTIKTVVEESDIPLHISTQSGVHDRYSAEFYKKMGASRVVLARECFPADIKAVKSIGIETEVFIHGALCVSVSGGCLMSSMACGLSGNRGKCLQLCRKEYTCEEYGNSGFLLSAKDLCLINRLSDLKALGVDSLKIEGRNRRPEYSGIITACYRQALDNNLSAVELQSLIGEMQKAFYRGYTSGYDKDRNIINSRCQNHVGVPIGKVVDTVKIKGFNFAFIKSEYKISKGDGLKILCKGQEVGGSDVTSVILEKGLQKVPVSDGVTSGNDVHLTSCENQLKSVCENVKKLEVDFVLDLQKDNAILSASCNNVSVSLQGDQVGAQNEDFPSRAESQISKCGNTPFVSNSIKVIGLGTLKISSLNQLRRNILHELEKKIISEYRREIRDKIPLNFPEDRKKHNGEIIEIDSFDGQNNFQSDSVVVFQPKFLTVDYIKEALTNLRLVGINPYIKLPRIIHTGIFEKISDFLIAEKVSLFAENNSLVEFARQNNLSYIAGIGLNVYNRTAINFYGDADAIIISPEVGLDSDLCDLNPYVFSYGALPLMTLLHCPHRTNGKSNGCTDCKQRCRTLTYKDQGGRLFRLIPTVTDCGCIFTLYNESITEIKDVGCFKKYKSFVGIDRKFKAKNLGYINKEVL